MTQLKKSVQKIAASPSHCGQILAEVKVVTLLPAVLMLFNLLSTFTLSAQSSEYTLIFQITADEAQTLYQHKKKDVYSEPYLYQLVDSFRQTAPELPTGHYLYVRAIEEALHIQQHSIHQYGVQQVTDGNYLSLEVRDTNGQIVNNGHLLFENQVIAWKEEHNLYRTKRPREDGWLRVELPGDTLFYQVKHSKIKAQRRKFFRTPIGYIISTPYRWAKNTYHFFKRGIGRGNWYLNWRRAWPFPQRDRRFKGYLALNQPRYRPGDTLRVKAYLTKRNGQPYKKPVQVEIRGNHRQKVLKEQLTPDRPGAFTAEVVLADTLKLDQNYSVNFSVPNKGRFGTKSEYFKLEDYQLDAATFAFTSPETNYCAGEPIVFTASGKDQNGNPLPGASVAVVALRQNITDIGPDSLLIPDTLWTYRQDLSLREATKIRFPDSLLPPADLGIKVEAFFANAGGEADQKTINLQYNYQAGKIEHELENGQWLFRYLDADSSLSKKATLITSRSIPPHRSERAITLPHQEEVDPFVTFYKIETAEKLKHTVSVAGNHKAELRVTGEHLGDSLYVRFINPHKLDVRYQLYEGKQLIKDGELNEDFTHLQAAKLNARYLITYQYTWGGAARDGYQSYRTYDRQLQLTTELPAQIYPGQTVQVKIKATDHKERAAKGVEMVAGAINGQFNSMEHLSPPQVTFKKKKGPRQRHKFNLQKVNGRYQSLISKKWYQHLSLDTALYYKIRYPEQGIFLQTDTITKDSFYLKQPQISPYVVEDGQLQPVYLIYLNRELVYSHFSEDNKPYAFNGRPGNNQLRVRTRNAEYRIDRLKLKAGHKLTLSLDTKSFGTYPDDDLRATWVPAKPYLSAGEKSLLNQKMIRIRKEEKRTASYLFSDSTQIYQWNDTYPHTQTKIIGPVPINQQLTYLQRDGLENTFLYEPGYIYEIREGRERLYKNTFLKPEKKYDLPKTLPHPSIDQLALRPSDIIAVSPKEKRINYRVSWQYDALQGGALQFFYDQKNDSTLIAVSLQNINGRYGIYPSGRTNFKSVPAGYYQLTLITPGGFTSSRNCWIYNNKLQVLDLRGATFEQDTTLSIFDDFYSYDLIKPSFLSYQETPSKTNNRYQDIGYLASGTVTDENGEPLIGANILLAGTEIGTVTDFDGKWSLWVPNANAILQVSYTGFSDRQVKATDAESALALEEGTMLDEVVVIGYSVPLIEQDNTTQGATLTSAQIRRLPTRDIKALAATSAGIGVVDDGDFINVRGSRDAATNYYVDGVRVSGRLIPESEINTFNKQQSNQLNLESGLQNIGSGLRNNFRDYGFWQPNLITDDQGEAYFQVTFPDDITSWKTYVLGMDKRKRAGAWYGETRAFQPVLAQLYLPRFLLPGDKIDLVGSSVNYTNDTFQIQTQFEVEGETLLNEEHQLIDGITDEITYTATNSRDSLTAKYTLQTGNYQDGEERSIPIFRVGTEETIGSFHRLEGDTSIQLNFPPEDGPITIYAQPDMLRVMLTEIDALIDYPYGCNEQSASRLLALLMHKEIQDVLGKPFTHEEDIQKMVALLRQRQLGDGSWGWWGGSPRNHWMTIYVLRALHAAKKAGYITEAYEKGLIFLTNQLGDLKGKHRLEAIALFSETGQNMDYATLLQPYDTLRGLNWTTLTTTLIQVQQDLPYQLDTLAKYRKATLFGGHYWGNPGYGFYHNTQQYSLLAYRIYQQAEQEAALQPIQQYFLEQRHRTPGYHRWAGYRNTFEAALILRTVLPDLLKDYQQYSKLELQQQIEITAGETIRWDSLPQQITITANEPIRLRKTGVGNTYLTAYQQRWNPQPKRVEGPFIVSSSLWQGNKKTERLEQSRPAFMKVELTVEKAAEYVMLEVPIPAGCSYGSKNQRRTYTETYREYRRDKVAIFCESLRPGKYTYTIELEPRFTGRFQLNPAKAEQMYFPVFYGREGMKVVKIEE